MRKRSKYRPRPVDCFVTPGLLDQLGQDMHFAIMALEHGAVTRGNWKRVGKVLVVVHGAAEGDPRFTGGSDYVALTSAILTLHAMLRDAESAGEWRMSDLDRMSLTRGIVAAERMIPRVKVGKLAVAYRRELVV